MFAHPLTCRHMYIHKEIPMSINFSNWNFFSLKFTSGAISSQFHLMHKEHTPPSAGSFKGVTELLLTKKLNLSGGKPIEVLSKHSSSIIHNYANFMFTHSSSTNDIGEKQ